MNSTHLRVDDLAEVQQQSGDESQDGQVEECPICFDVLSDGVVTGCCHIFCRECISEFVPFVVTPTALKNSPTTSGYPQQPSHEQRAEHE